MDTTILRRKAHHLKPQVRIGKAGISQGLIEEITAQLKKHKLVKIRLLQSFADLYDVPQAVEQIVQSTKSSLVEHKGSVVVIYKK